MTDYIFSRKGIIGQIRDIEPLSLDCSQLRRGIDNYHVDVYLSSTFVTRAQETSEEVVRQVVAETRPRPSNSAVFREAYADMVKTMLHRAKKDLGADEIQFLQFGIIKFVLLEVRKQLDEVVSQLEESVAQQQFSGSRNLLPSKERFSWLRKHYGEFLFLANRAVLDPLRKEESNRLKDVRRLLLGDEGADLLKVMFNPMLAAANPQDLMLLVDSYALWPKGGEGFNEFNSTFELLIQKQISELNVTALKTRNPKGFPASEVYDTFRGLFLSQNILGPSENQNKRIVEELCWLEQPSHLRLLFGRTAHEKLLSNAENHLGLFRRLRLKFAVNKLQQSLREVRKKLITDSELKETMAGYLLKGNWSTADERIIDLRSACAFVAGNDTRKILGRIDRSKSGAEKLIKRLDRLAKELNKQFVEESDSKFLQLLVDLSRYRLHIKSFRFGHSALNRINIISDPEEIQLARAGGKLYELTGPGDSMDLNAEEQEVIKHTIIKADVRGSTKVIGELVRQGLNPASYFSLRFFNPINELLEKYGASKVFIEGDAIILNIDEKNNEPEQWYSVARACGIARDIVSIVYSKNSHSKQTGLPTLEIGIGISYCDDKALFLFDENRPIMISPAIGEADRLSSCSWNLREVFKNNANNVEVLKIAEGEQTKGEKGQAFVRYNVNGVLLADPGFEKLKSEIRLKKYEMKFDGSLQTMFVGKFPDVNGKERDLVIRQGQIGLWKNERLTRSKSDAVFYEVMPDSKVTSKVLKASRRKLF